MTQWLFDTLIYSGLLIALVLLVRRPVSKHFGPQIAYALWALPLLRFIMPPIVLPAAFAPAEQPVEAIADNQPIMVLVEAEFAAEAGAAAPVASASWALTDILLPLWLAGAAIFLFWRARDYLAMRRDLLAQARPVGEAGKVRLVETPAVSSPVAFGISDKVIALPPGFMGHHNIAARDMAIAHELAHHRGHDLVANIAAQPLLAMHWFNPLAWWGWRAMRRDQEAACDARVVAGCKRSERAAYAEVIAGFAAGPKLALAAPMACPVLGEKSIIHRLRSLTMSDISSGRKKLGIAAIATTALVALPITASISYAQEEAPLAPEPPTPPTVAPDAPEPPAPPSPPTIETIDPNGEHRIIRIERGNDGDEESRVARRHVIIERDGERHEFFDEGEIDAMLAEIDIDLEGLEDIEQHVELALAEAREARGQAATVRTEARVMALHNGSVELLNECDGTDTVQHRESVDGHRVMVICQAAAHNQAAMALRQAQRALEANQELSRELRDEILEELQEAIEEVEQHKISASEISARELHKMRLMVPVRNIQAKVLVPAPAAPSEPPQIIRTSSVKFQTWRRSEMAPAMADAEDCEEEEEIGYTT